MNKHHGEIWVDPKELRGFLLVKEEGKRDGEGDWTMQAEAGGKEETRAQLLLRQLLHAGEGCKPCPSQVPLKEHSSAAQ